LILSIWAIGKDHQIKIMYEQIPGSELPDTLYIKIPRSGLKRVLERGLSRRGREYVYLTSDLETLKVGFRKYTDVILSIDTRRAGWEFYRLENRLVISPSDIPSSHISVEKYL
jgi:RNA:NAD 2'-phosphotransferase (TPT1/KptA family)